MRPTIFILIFSIISFQLFAKVYTVSNNPSNPAQYATITDALNSASAGDTIYVYGSPNVYFGASFSKSNITFIGPGFNPQKQSALTATCASDNNVVEWSVGNNNKFIGLTLSGDFKVLSSSAVVFSRCSLQSISLAGTNTNLLIEDCIVRGNISIVNTTFSNAVIRNNIWYGGFYVGGGGSSFNNVLFDHNVIIGGYGSFYSGGALSGLTFSNNIILNTTVNAASSQYIFQNNFSNSQDLNTSPNGTANIYGTDPLFVNYDLNPNVFNFSLDFHLQPSSVCKNSGTGGTGDDMGVYSGVAPFVWSGEADIIPKITVFNVMGNQFLSNGNATIHFESAVSH
jgi:hypothetical protein